MLHDKLNSLKDASVDEIYASHVLEYFDRNEVNAVLLEWKRVLKKNGIKQMNILNIFIKIQISVVKICAKDNGLKENQKK